MTEPNSRFQNAIERLDALHGEDPRQESIDGQNVPHELLYARRMSEWLERVAPDAGEALRLAVRAQHLQRWRIPRDDYPRDRPGYLAWRRELGRLQAERASAVLREAGYEDDIRERVGGLIRKERLHSDPDTQALEDTACLVFMAHYLDAFAADHDEVKLLRIVRKTWHKMSPRGHELIASISFSTDTQALIRKALA